jgi:hypothetical protein
VCTPTDLRHVEIFNNHIRDIRRRVDVGDKRRLLALVENRANAIEKIVARFVTTLRARDHDRVRDGAHVLKVVPRETRHAMFSERTTLRRLDVLDAVESEVT